MTPAEQSTTLMRQAEELGTIKGAIRALFEYGGVDGAALPVACRKDGPWQSPGTVAVKVEALRYLWRKAGLDDV